MNTSFRTFFHFTFVGLLLAANGARGETHGSSALLPFPQADYAYPTASFPFVDSAAEYSTADTGRYPASTQPHAVGSRFLAAGLEMSAAPHDLQDFESAEASVAEELIVAGEESCDCDDCCASSPCCGWFGSTTALFMTRNEGSHYQFSFDNEPLGSRDHIRLLDIREAAMKVSGGFDVRLGRYFRGGQLGVEFVYWGLYPGVEQRVLTPTGFVGQLDTFLNFDRVSIGGQGVNAWTSNADAHRVRRNFEIHNAEINLLNFRGCTVYAANGCPKFGFSWGAGFRFFHFSEGLRFSARENGGGTSFDDGQNQIDYSIAVDNNLFGGQVGGEGRWFATNKLSLVLSTKVGLFGNTIRHRSRIEDERGRIAVVNDGPLTGASWDVNASKVGVAFLAELNLGLNYCLTQHLSLLAGYRAMGVSGVALSADQIPNDLRQVNQAYVINSDSGLLLHGGYAGIEFLY